MAFLLDTNIAIHIGDRDIAVSRGVAQLSGRKLLSVITVVELENGVVAMPQLAAMRRAVLTEMTQSFGVIGCDEEIVRAYSRIVGATGFSRPRVLDRLIAATALVHDLTLVTINGSDFRDIPGLKLEVWPAPDQ